MKINFKSLFGTTMLTVLLALLIFSIVGAPIADWVKDKLNIGGSSPYDGTPMGYNGHENLSPAQVRRELHRMRKEAADRAEVQLREVNRKVNA